MDTISAHEVIRQQDQSIEQLIDESRQLRAEVERLREVATAARALARREDGMDMARWLVDTGDRWLCVACDSEGEELIHFCHEAHCCGVALDRALAALDAGEVE